MRERERERERETDRQTDGETERQRETHRLGPERKREWQKDPNHRLKSRTLRWARTSTVMTDAAVDGGDDNMSSVAGVVEEVWEEGDTGSAQLVGIPGDDDSNTLNSLVTITTVVYPMKTL